MRRSTSLFLALIAASSFVLAACGDTEDGRSTDEHMSDSGKDDPMGGGMGHPGVPRNTCTPSLEGASSGLDTTRATPAAEPGGTWPARPGAASSRPRTVAGRRFGSCRRERAAAQDGHEHGLRTPAK